MSQIREVMLEPSHEIHLARIPAAASRVRLNVLFKEELMQPNAQGHDYTITDVTASMNTHIGIQVAPSSTQYVNYDSATRELSISAASGTGQNTLIFTYNDSGTPCGRSILVHVHNNLNAWWLGNKQITVPRHPHVYHCQATVYGHFDAPSQKQAKVIADITGHDYISFSLPNIVPNDPTPIASLDPNGRGRIRGNWVGTTKLRATFNGRPEDFNGRQEDIDIKVKDSYCSPSNWADISTIPAGNTYQMLERVSLSVAETTHSQDPGHVRGRGINDRLNLLFVSEGFTSAEEYLFDYAVEQMADRMFSSLVHSPFNLLSGNFNIWKAFIPSNESGITFGRASYWGAPLPKTQPYLFQVKDSALGLYYAYRQADQFVDKGNVANLDYSVIGDPRRYPHELNWAKAIGRQIAGLSHRSIIGTDGTPDRLGRVWYNDHPNNHANAFLRDMGLVCILVNEHSSGFPSEHHGLFLIMGVYHSAMNTSRDFDPPRPAESFQWKVSRKQSLNPSKTTVRTSFQRCLNENTETLAHELCHAFALGDEYETAVGDGAARGMGETTWQTKSRFGNVAIHAAIKPVGAAANSPNINPGKLRWAKLHRVVRSDRIVSINTDTSNPTKLTLTVTLDTSNAARWNLPAGNNTHVYLREFRAIPETNPNPEPDGRLYGISGLRYRVNAFRYFPNPDEHDLVIIENCTVSSVSGNNQVVLTVPRTSSSPLPPPLKDVSNADLPAEITKRFAPGGLMYIPQLYTNTTQPNTPVFLVDYEVLAYMNDNHAPLYTNWNAQSNSCAPAANRQAVDRPPARILTSGSGRRYPPHDFLILGAYEGADHATCKIYRPTGSCKMRNTHEVSAYPLTIQPNLCYFCKYNIVHFVNPQFLEMIERQYPNFK